MKTDTTHIREYLAETLGLDVGPCTAGDATTLPPFLASRYRVFTALVERRPAVFVIDLKGEDPPTVVQKHLAQIADRMRRKAQSGDAPALVYVRDRMSPHNRKRLVQARIPFVVPGTQAYLPPLGIDLRERFAREPAGERPFRPATQLVLIDALLRAAEPTLRAAELARRLGYTSMTIGRAFDELEAAALVRSTTVGKERLVTLAGPRRAIWEAAQARLSTPVLHRRFVRGPQPSPGALKAGLSALADYSMLADPPNATIAISEAAWRSYRERPDIAVIPLQDSDSMTVEVWSYAPRPGPRADAVDPLSLSLSITPTSDERVEQALDSMIGGLGW